MHSIPFLYNLTHQDKSSRLDNYIIQIDKFPAIDGQILDINYLFHYWKRNFISYVNCIHTRFEYKTNATQKRWYSDNPLHVEFTIHFPHTEAIVSCSEYLCSKYLSYWAFQTKNHASFFKGHPLTGYRYFGLIEIEQKTFLFNIGISKVSHPLYSFVRPLIYFLSKQLWASQQKQLIQFIHKNGGKANAASLPVNHFLNYTTN